MRNLKEFKAEKAIQDIKRADSEYDDEATTQDSSDDEVDEQ